MNEEQGKPKQNLNNWAAGEILQFLKACPQIVQPGIGIEVFVEELNKASIKFNEYFGIN